MKTIKITFQILFFGIIVLGHSCKRFVEIDPPKDQITNDKVYTSNETATAAMRGVYAQMMSEYGFASGSVYSVTLLAGRSADEFINYNPDENYIQFIANNLLPENIHLRTGLWQQPYRTIYLANSVIENLQGATGVSIATARQLTGEAKFVRAFAHFYLTNLFGKVPIILTTDYQKNIIAKQGTVAEVYVQIVSDLKEAVDLLSENYPAADRTRVNKWAAKALLARVYLYQKDWINAEKEATEVISTKNSYRIVEDLNDVF